MFIVFAGSSWYTYNKY